MPGTPCEGRERSAGVGERSCVVAMFHNGNYVHLYVVSEHRRIEKNSFDFFFAPIYRSCAINHSRLSLIPTTTFSEWETCSQERCRFAKDHGYWSPQRTRTENESEI